MPSHAEIAATALIDSARSGQDAAIEMLIEAVWPHAYRIARGIVGDAAAAQDAAQDACVIVYRKIGSLRDGKAFNTWFYRVVTRQALRQRKIVDAFESLDSNVPSDTESPDIATDLWSALRALSAVHRAVVILFYFEGLSTREIAAVMHVPDATVRFRLFAARKRLHDALRPATAPLDKKSEELYAF